MTTKKKKSTDIIKVVADSDKPCPPKAESIDYIKDAIYTIRGVKVMLDSDLAEIYGYQTSRFNQQVKQHREIRCRFQVPTHQRRISSDFEVKNFDLKNFHNKLKSK